VKERNYIPLVIATCFSGMLIFFYPLSLPTPLLEPDEGLHAAISQEMLEHNEWVVPTILGEPFLDKPILYFWAQMISLKAFGTHEWAVRLPGLMFGLVGSLTTGLLASRLFGSLAGIVATLMSMTMFFPLALAQAATHDVALVPWTNLMILCLWESERSMSIKSRFLWIGGAAFMVGLAVLTKALIGIAIICIGHGLFLIVSRRLSLTSIVRLLAVLAIGLLIASPWYIAMEIRSRGYLYYYFIERHLLGFATATQPHGNQPWFYYAPVILLGAMPWMGFIAPLLYDEYQRYKKQATTSPATILLLCWITGGVIFLSIAKSKLSTYALPMFPPIAILAAVSWQRFASSQFLPSSRNWFIWTNRVSGIAGVTSPLVMVVGFQFLFHTSYPLTYWLMTALVSAISILSIMDFEGRRYERSLAWGCTWVGALTAISMTWPFQNVAESYSQRKLAEWINRQDSLPKHLILVGANPSSVIFYLKPEWRRSLRPDQFYRLRTQDLAAELTLHSDDILAVTRKVTSQLEKEHPQTLVSFDAVAGQFGIVRREKEDQ
jgi:4-amino-4-deoxy-L-arabinose transferase-like glycosyltransferase